MPPVSVITRIYGTHTSIGDANTPKVSYQVSKRLREFQRDEQYDGAARDELYKLLELKDEAATETEIKAAYRQVRLKWTIPKDDRPNDEIDDHAQMRIAWIDTAYAILSKPELRRWWDERNYRLR